MLFLLLIFSILTFLRISAKTLEMLEVSTISGILAVAGLPSLLTNVMFLLSVADFSTACSGGPMADVIHDVPIVSAAAVISDFNSVPACWLLYLCKYPCFSWRL